MKDWRRKVLHGVGLGLAAVVISVVLYLAGALTTWEHTTWDWRVRQQAQARVSAGTAAADSICVVLLDQASLDWGEQENGWPWPWPREVYTTILAFCQEGGARSVAFDVLFTESSQNGVSDDEALGGAIADHGRFIGAVFVKGSPEDPGDPSITWPIAEVADSARLLANVSDISDPDGIFRQATLWRRTAVTDIPGGVIPSLGAAAWLLGQSPAEVPPWSIDRFGSDPAPQRILNYHAPEKAWPVYSAAAVIQSALQIFDGDTPTLDPSVVAGRHVLFGFSAPGLMDLRPTPLSRVSPGVSIHATVLANLMDDDFVQEAPQPLWIFVSGLMAVLVAFGILLAPRVWHTVLVLLVGLALPAVVGLLAVGQTVWWPVVPGTLAQGIASAGAMIVAWATEGRQKRFIRQAFRHYLSPHVIDRIVADPDSLRLGGERRDLSILFSDLEGFTTISEGLEPQELTTLLNEFLSDMTDIILAEGGTLDKYEGDAIIAFWNAPVDQPDHAQRACRAAVLCQRQLTHRRAEFKDRFGVELHMRIGLNSGPVIVGNMGSKQRFDYTVLGDAANLAARLEGANKVFGTYLMVSESTRDGAGSTVTSRHLGDLRVVGRKQPVRVFEVDGMAGDDEPTHWGPYAEALALAEAGQATAASAAFASLNDPAAASWLKRLEDEDDGFDAVWNLTKK